MNIKIIAFVVLLALAFCQVVAQDLSNKGKDFWVAYAGHIDGTTSRMALYITSDQNATGVVDINGSTIPFNVTANQVTTVQLTNSSTPGNSLAYNGQVEGIGAKKGIHITADKPVAVYAHILNAARSGSTLVLPTNVLGKEYYVASYKSTTSATNRRSQFNVVATMDNTTVQITPTQADGNGSHPANVPFTITLSKGDVYQYQSDEDLTGTYIKSIGSTGTSCQPIAVFSGSTFASMGCSSAGTGDNLYQQLFPFGSWGKVYYTAPFISRSYDIFRILIQDPTEPVYVNGVALSASTLIAGRFYEINTQGNNTPRIITSGKPICVLQYLITQGCDGVQSDPEMVVLNPIEQTLNDITVMSARNNLTPPNTNISTHYLNVIFKTNSLNSLRIDGAPPTVAPIAIAGTDYSYIQQDVTASTTVNPTHRITSDSGFICIAYGYGNVESYGYNAGANVKDLYQFVSIQNQYASVDFPATCKGAPFHFNMTFPYQPTQIRWIFGSSLNAMGLNDTTIINPGYDSTWNINGKQLYKYKLPNPYRIAATGNFPIKLLAQNPTPDGCGGEQEINYELQVYERPAARFQFTTSGCASDTVAFKDVSLTNGRSTYQWYWNFADGGSSAAQNPSHLFNKEGNYQVSFAVVTDIGCLSDTASQTVAVFAVPTARFSVPPVICATKDINFVDQSGISTGNITAWKWNMGMGADTTRTTNAPFNVTYPAAGSYRVRLITESDKGCLSRSFDTTITVHAQPVPGFAMSANCLVDPFSEFTDTSSIADGTQGQFTYLWNFGDPNATAPNPNTSTLKSPRHRYSSAITYNVSLTVSSNNGCVASLTKPFTINGSVPQSIFSVAGGNSHCSNDSVKITNHSIADVGSIVKLEIYWDYANDPGNKQTELNPPVGKTFAFRYPEFFTAVPKTYTIKVVAYSGINCLKDSTITIQVLPTPEIQLNPLNAVCGNSPGSTLTAAAVLNNAGGTGSYSGPGVSANGLYNPSAAGAGDHLIRYTHTAANGCTNFREQTIKVYPVPTVNAGPDLNILEGGTDSLRGSGSGVNVKYQWTPAQWLNNNTAARPLTTPLDDITYTLQLTSSDGCAATDDVFVRVLKAPAVPNVFTPNGDGINDKWEIKYLNTYPGAAIEIFNRYGQLIFQSKGYPKPWDGTYNGKAVPAGTYYYIINPKNGRKQIAGFVDIVR